MHSTAVSLLSTNHMADWASNGSAGLKYCRMKTGTESVKQHPLPAPSSCKQLDDSSSLFCASILIQREVSQRSNSCPTVRIQIPVFHYTMLYSCRAGIRANLSSLLVQPSTRASHDEGQKSPGDRQAFHSHSRCIAVDTGMCLVQCTALHVSTFARIQVFCNHPPQSHSGMCRCLEQCNYPHFHKSAHTQASCSLSRTTLHHTYKYPEQSSVRLYNPAHILPLGSPHPDILGCNHKHLELHIAHVLYMDFHTRVSCNQSLTIQNRTHRDQDQHSAHRFHS